jgi:3-hydroxyisobutyrate dehydrogenase
VARTDGRARAAGLTIALEDIMAKVGFIGLGNMGMPMAENLLKAAYEVTGFDLNADATERLAHKGASRANSLADACNAAEIIITMLPAGEHVREVYLGAGGVLASVGPGTLLIDSSTIDVQTAREVAQAAQNNGLAMVDAPVSGGVAGAEAATLTFMVGGSDEAFERARPVLEGMGKTIVHAGAPGNGQAAKICNNMILGVSMIVVSEAFLLAEKLGLDAQKLFDISSKSSGQCWSMTSYCPVPGLVPASPANRDYKAGFTAAMMLKDLKLAQTAARATHATTPLGAGAAAVYERFVESSDGSVDFSGIIRYLRGA